MKIDEKVKDRIKKVLDSQSIAVLGTSKNDEPYSCLVGYEITNDLKSAIFATMRKRLKYENIAANPRVTLIIDDRDQKDSSFNETTSITIVGKANDIVNEDREKYAELLVKRHPSLTDFVESPDCAIIKVDVDKIYVVSEFESVVKIGK
ncbi:MAG: pyridoxamine 5'-phosphate oxidase family protein [Candidatus Thorarchaeota archaeon]